MNSSTGQTTKRQEREEAKRQKEAAEEEARKKALDERYRAMVEAMLAERGNHTSP